MFSREKVAQVDPIYPKSEIPKSVVEFMTQKAYEEVAQSIGFMPAELVCAKLLAFFEEKSIELFDYDQVVTWLSMKKKQVRQESWCWRPLLGSDIATGYQWGDRAEFGNLKDGYYHSRNWECRPYEQLVPIPVLENVAMIKERFGDHVKFFVSDYATPRPDPFIMVRPAMCNSGLDKDYHFIFAHWDEPGFGK